MTNITLTEIRSFAELFNVAILDRCMKDSAFRADFARHMRRGEPERINKQSELLKDDAVSAHVGIAEIHLDIMRRREGSEAQTMLRKIFISALRNSLRPYVPSKLAGLQEKLEEMNAPHLAREIGAVLVPVN